MGNVLLFVYNCNSATSSLLLGRVALGAQRPIVVKLSRERSVGLSVQCIVEKTADRIRMPFRIIRWTGLRMRQVVGFADRSTGMGTFGSAFGARHCMQWGLYGVRVRQCLNRRRYRLRWCVRWPRHCCIRWGQRRARGREGFLLGGLFCIFTETNTIASPTVKCFRFVC